MLLDMALRHAVMASLLAGEASGYELAKRFDAAIASYWAATPQQLYRELERLEAEGLLSGRVVEQERRPNKRLFSLTLEGRDALAEFTSVAARPTKIRDELLVKVQAVDVGDASAVADAIRARIELAREKLATYEAMRAGILAGREEDDFLSSGERIGPYLVLIRGRSFERETLEWGEAVLDVLKRRRIGTA